MYSSLCKYQTQSQARHFSPMAAHVAFEIPASIPYQIGSREHMEAQRRHERHMATQRQREEEEGANLLFGDDDDDDMGPGNDVSLDEDRDTDWLGAAARVYLDGNMSHALFLSRQDQQEVDSKWRAFTQQQARGRGRGPPPRGLDSWLLNRNLHGRKIEPKQALCDAPRLIDYIKTSHPAVHNALMVFAKIEHVYLFRDFASAKRAVLNNNRVIAVDASGGNVVKMQGSSVAFNKGNQSNNPNALKLYTYTSVADDMARSAEILASCKRIYNQALASGRDKMDEIELERHRVRQTVGKVESEMQALRDEMGEGQRQIKDVEDRIYDMQEKKHRHVSAADLQHNLSLEIETL
eukprot:g9408.t1